MEIIIREEEEDGKENEKSHIEKGKEMAKKKKTQDQTA